MILHCRSLDCWKSKTCVAIFAWGIKAHRCECETSVMEHLYLFMRKLCTCSIASGDRNSMMRARTRRAWANRRFLPKLVLSARLGRYFRSLAKTRQPFVQHISATNQRHHQSRSSKSRKHQKRRGYLTASTTTRSHAVQSPQLRVHAAPPSNPSTTHPPRWRKRTQWFPPLAFLSRRMEIWKQCGKVRQPFVAACTCSHYPALRCGRFTTCCFHHELHRHGSCS
jgi:hypothetical protein